MMTAHGGLRTLIFIFNYEYFYMIKPWHGAVGSHQRPGSQTCSHQSQSESPPTSHLPPLSILWSSLSYNTALSTLTTSQHSHGPKYFHSP